MKLRTLVVGAVVAVLCFGPSFAQVITTLTVTETAKVARQAEPVTNGIPLPAGLVKDAGELSLQTANGLAVPAAFSVLNRWPADGSARWVLLDAQLDVPAGGTVELALVKGKPSAALPGKLDVADTADTISVDTGVAQFTVRKKGFGLFESLALGGTRVCNPSPGGLSMTVAGQTFSSRNDATSAVIVEEQNAMRVALLATGKLTDASGKTGFDYQVRIHAYRNSPLIKVVPTVIKKYGTRKDPAAVSGLSMELYMGLAGLGREQAVKLKYVLGTDEAPAQGDVFKSAFVHADTSDSFKLGGDAEGGGKGKSVKPLTLGWGDLSRQDGPGVAAGVRRFWQTFPKAIEAVAGGEPGLLVHLYPPMHKDPVEVFTGMARTHEVLVIPHGRTTPEELQARFVAFQKPLYAFASPKWYCRDSGGLGLLAEAAALDPKLFGQYTDQVAAFDKKMSSILQTLAGPAQDNWQKRGVTMDAYGWLAYGDTLHWVWLKEDGVKEPLGSPWTIAWDSNYYDMPHVAAQHFARTGGREFFEFFVDHSWHLMDVGVVHWEPNVPGGGGSRRCPATNHVGFDPPEHASPTVNYAFDHHKSESLFERYYFLGDRWALATAMELLGHAFDPKANGGKNGDYAGTRKPAHQVITLVAGYWCTGEKKYLEKAREVINTGIERQKANNGGFNPKPNFTDGICSEAFSKYYLAAGQADVLDAVKALDDFLITHKYTKWGNPAMGHGLAYSRTGEQKYLDAGLENLTSKPGHLGKDSADMFRNAANFLGLVVQRLEKKD